MINRLKTENTLGINAEGYQAPEKMSVFFLNENEMLSRSKTYGNTEDSLGDAL